MSEIKDFHKVVGEQIGFASMCWNPKPTGVFESTDASMAVDAIIRAHDAEIAALKAELEVCRSGLVAVQDLINASTGVMGLHLNGDLASWESLQTGGGFEEWLCLFDAAMQSGTSESPPSSA